MQAILIQIGEGQTLQALSNYNKAIEINPARAEAYYNRGCVYDKKGDLTEALSDYNKAIELNPDFAEAYYNRAVAYYQLNEYDQAWINVQKVEALGGTANPDFINALRSKSNPDK